MADPKEKDGLLDSGVERPEDAYSVEYLRDCASGEAREERLAELRRRIRLGAYRVDAQTIADELLRRGDLASDE